MSFIIIPRWDSPDGFQHYKDRDPKWIKVYTRLLDDDSYLSLTVTQRAVLHGLWLMYAKSAGKVPENTSKLSRRLGIRVTKRTLDALNQAGFIEFSLAEPEQVVSLEKRREEKKEQVHAAPRKVRVATPRIERPRDLLWDALVTAMGRTPETEMERGKWNAALKQIRVAGAGPEDIIGRAKAYRQEWPEMELTPFGLASHWSRFNGKGQASPIELRLAELALKEAA